MRTFQVPTSRRIKGFTLVELLIVVLIISIFITFASVNWNVTTKTGKEALLEAFSIRVALIREDAISHYEDRVLEFDVTNDEIRTGRMDVKNGFIETGLLHLSEDYRIKDVVINGTPFPMGKCYMTFYASGMVDRTLVHLEGSSQYYSLLINPLTAKVTGKDGYINETSVKNRNNAS
jgi:prepilin-type N-terminal cleavage/methylation domain-containing protein